MTEGESITKAVFAGQAGGDSPGVLFRSRPAGTLVELEYDTYESMTYEEQEQSFI